MAVTIDGNRLERHLGGKYGGYTREGDHRRFFWDIDGVEYGGAKFSHGSKNKDLPDFVASSIAKKLGVNRDELKSMERCSFSKAQLLERLRNT